jgi:paraquat-inducible protein B
LSQDKPEDYSRETDDMESGLPVAHVRATPWRGWIWSVPLAAMILVGFLVVRTWLFTGPTVEVRFSNASGLNPSGTGVFCRGVQMGHLRSLRLTKRGTSVIATLAMDADADPLLRKGTRFYIQQPNLLAGNLANLISGPVIEMVPGTGAACHRFVALRHAPVITPHIPGQTVMVTTHSLGNLHRGSRVYYHGLRAGKLLGWNYSRHKHLILLHVFIKNTFAKRLGYASRFWRVGALNIATGAHGLTVQPAPLSVLLSGAIAFADFKSPVAKTPQHFPLYASQTAATDVLCGRHVLFSTVMDAGERLRPGAPVSYGGFTVGTVRTVGFIFSKSKGTMLMPVTLALYPAQFHIGLRARHVAHWRSKFIGLINRLVHSGLRVQEAQSSMIFGGEHLSLVMAGRETHGELAHFDGLTELPSMTGAGLNAILASIGRISGKINALPIAAIGANVERLSAGASSLVNSPQLAQSLARLDRSLGSIATITASARGQVTPTMVSINKAVHQAAKVAAAIGKIVGDSYNHPQNMRVLISELIRMARAIRSLANYLNAHPEALIEGRSK